MSAQYKSEYNNSMVGKKFGGYSSLGSYYGPNSTMASIRPTTTQGAMVVPMYGNIGYDALTHGSNPSYGGHFNISNAYGAGAGSCSTSYSTRLCGGKQQ